MKQILFKVLPSPILVWISCYLISSLPVVASAQTPIEALAKNYEFLTSIERVRVHRLVMKIMANQAKRTPYQDQEILEKFSSYDYIRLLNFMINEARADGENPEMFCNFGGWISTFDNKNKCRAPWSRSVRDDSRLEIFGPVYSGQYSCGGARLFRCNPMVFGPGDDGRGICTSANDSDPQSSTQACLDALEGRGQNIRALIESYRDDPEKYSQYIALVAETLRFCRNSNEEVSYCSELNQTLLNINSSSLRCSDRQELKTYLPDIITPFNLDEINSITNNLGTEAQEYRRTLEKRQREARQHNRKVYEDAIAAYTNSTLVKDTIDRVIDNADECLLGSCRGSKSPFNSLAYCARYVKLAMFPPVDDGKESFGDWSEYPWGSDAVESGEWLRREGMVNLMDIPEMRHLTPETAPIGSVIVYDKPDSRRRYNVDGVIRGGPGHVEIRASEDQYVSDFINDEPTTIGGERRPIGIYVKIAPEFRQRLQEVPER